MKLTDVKIKNTVIVDKLYFKDKTRERMLSLGLTPGTKVTVLKKGPKNNLAIYKFRGCKIALRNTESDLIIVKE